MDKVQNNLMKIVTEHPQCLSDKVMLRGLLTDLLPHNRREINLIMDAYETRIAERLSYAHDYHLEITGIKMQLLQDFGLTEQAASWAIASWCYMLNRPEVAKISEVEDNSGLPQKNTQPAPEKKNAVNDALLAFLKGKKLRIVDKRPSGGCLWVIGTESEIGKTIKEAEKVFSVSGTFCGGGKATGYKPGWYMTSNK